MAILRFGASCPPVLEPSRYDQLYEAQLRRPRCGRPSTRFKSHPTRAASGSMMRAVREIRDYLEASTNKAGGEIRGKSGFAERFSAGAPRTQGRAWYELDLKGA